MLTYDVPQAAGCTKRHKVLTLGEIGAG